MKMMERLFGTGPDVTKKKESDASQEHITMLSKEKDIEYVKRMNQIISVIRGVIDGSNKEGKMTETAHNSVSQTTISYLTFDHNQKYTKITFNDLPQDDNFLCEVDLDANPTTARDVFMVKIGSDSSFIVERGHYDDEGLLHFSAVSHEDSSKLVTFLESAMNIQNHGMLV